MKVAITNTVLANGGDAAILLALVQQVKAVFGSETQCVILGSNPAAIRSHYQDLNLLETLASISFGRKREGIFRPLWGMLRFSWWYLSRIRLPLAAKHPWLRRWITGSKEQEVFDAYVSSDLVISTGGTYLVDHYWIAQPVLELSLVRLMGIPLVLYTQSMGPFEQSGFQPALKRIFEYASLILLRDKRSREALQRVMGPSTHTFLAPDAVLGLSRSTLPESYKNNKLKVAVSVRNWPYFKNTAASEGMAQYREAIGKTICALVVEQEAEVTFLSTCQGIPGYTYDDSEVAQAIYDTLPPDIKRHVTVRRGYHHPDDLLQLLSGFNLVIATRMHMAILSIVAGVPVLPIAYEFKTRELVESLGFTKRLPELESVDIESLQGTHLTTLAQQILAEESSWRGFMAAVYAEKKEEVIHHAMRMSDVVSRTSPQNKDAL